MPTKKKATTNQIHVFAGSDTEKVRAAAKDAASRLAPEDAGEFAVDTIDGNAETVDEAVQRIHQTNDALNTMSFFGGGKLVWLKNTSFLADNVIGRSESVKGALESLLSTLEEGLPDGIVFLLSAQGIDKRKSFAKKLLKIAEVQEFDRLDTSKSGWEAELASIARQRAQESGFRFERDALEYFIALSNAESRQVENDIEKLSLFLGGNDGVAKKEDVRQLVSETREGVIWEIGNAIAARDTRAALQLTGKFLRRGESAVGILLAAIVPTVRNLLYAKDLMVRNNLRPPDKPYFFGGTLKKLPARETDHLPRKKDGSVNAYPLGIAACHASRYSLQELKDALRACLDANIQLVTTQIDPDVILSKLLLQITAKQNKTTKNAL